MKLNKYFVIDFDSTFTQVEAFDVLADISLETHPDKEERIQKIKEIKIKKKVIMVTVLRPQLHHK